MSMRAIMIGLAMGLFVAGATYFNDAVIRQTYLIGHHLPVIVFGAVAVLLLVVHPLMRLGGGGFRSGEVAVATAIALAACGWPGNSFYRGFAPVVTMPAHWNKTQSHWIASDVMSFVPGGSGLLAPEHLPDAPALARQLRDAADAPETPAGRTWRLLDETDRWTVQRVADADAPSLHERRAFAATLNRVLDQPQFYTPEAFADVPVPDGLRAQLTAAAAGELDSFDRVRVNRQLLALAIPSLVLPAPPGEGVLFRDGRPDTPTHALMMSGAGGDRAMGLGDIAWDEWWPTLRLWGGLAIALGLAALCLALIVHPQWARHELLAYPIARFVQELGRTDEGRRLPRVAHHRGFWIGLIAVAAIHLINGLHAYFEYLPTIPLNLNLSGLRTLFPNASRVFGNEAYFTPVIYPSVVAFMLFVVGSVSFSVGIAHLLLMFLGAYQLSQGEAFDRDYLGGGKVNMMAFGAFVAMFAIIVYTGRRYYANVAAAMLGRARDPSTPAYARWAGWGLVLSLVAAVLVLRSGGLPLPLGAAFVLLVMLMWLIMSRIAAETGVFLIKPAWLPVGILTALFGFEAIGPTAYIALALATIILVGESREAIMPFLTNGLRLADQAGPTGPRRVSPWLALMIVLSLLVAGGASLVLQHNYGLNHADPFAVRDQVQRPFNEMARHISDTRARQTLDQAVAATGVERFTLIQPEPEAIGWASLGFALVLTTAAARLRLPWWPLHPILFLVWGTWPMFMFSFSILLGWAIKSALVGIGGTRAYHAAVPIALGVILGDILATLGWSLVGAIYFFATDLTPPIYRVFP